MNRIILRVFFTAVVSLTFVAVSSHECKAGIVSGIWTPNGLAAGDQYRLVFVTSGLFQAFDANLGFAIYDSTVNTAAEYGSLTGDTFSSPLSWKALVNVTGQPDGYGLRQRLSTTDILFGTWDGSDVPIYLLGTHDRVAAGWDQFFTAGGWDRGIDRNENGDLETGQGVWTGSLDNGEPATFPHKLGNPNPYGTLTSEKDFFNFTGTASDANHIFAISDVATVAAASVPEPSTAIAMGLLGIVGFACNRRRRQESVA